MKAIRALVSELIPIVSGLVIGFGTFAIFYWVLPEAWRQFKLLSPEVSTGLVTAAATVLAATVAVAVGKYYERKKDIEAHYREKKVEIYDQFLAALFEFMDSDGSQPGSNPKATKSLVNFLKEWQRKMILWGGQDVLAAYISWIGHLRKDTLNIQSMLLMDKFFREIRKDLGHKSNNLEKGALVGLTLRHPDVFLEKAKENPKMTIEELSKYETD